MTMRKQDINNNVSSMDSLKSFEISEARQYPRCITSEDVNNLASLLENQEYIIDFVADSGSIKFLCAHGQESFSVLPIVLFKSEDFTSTSLITIATWGKIRATGSSTGVPQHLRQKSAGKEFLSFYWSFLDNQLGNGHTVAAPLTPFEANDSIWADSNFSSDSSLGDMHFMQPVLSLDKGVPNDKFGKLDKWKATDPTATTAGFDLVGAAFEAGSIDLAGDNLPFVGIGFGYAQKGSTNLIPLSGLIGSQIGKSIDRKIDGRPTCFEQTEMTIWKKKRAALIDIGILPAEDSQEMGPPPQFGAVCAFYPKAEYRQGLDNDPSISIMDSPNTCYYTPEVEIGDGIRDINLSKEGNNNQQNLNGPNNNQQNWNGPNIQQQSWNGPNSNHGPNNQHQNLNGPNNNQNWNGPNSNNNWGGPNNNQNWNGPNNQQNWNGPNNHQNWNGPNQNNQQNHGPNNWNGPSNGPNNGPNNWNGPNHGPNSQNHGPNNGPNNWNGPNQHHGPNGPNNGPNGSNHGPNQNNWNGPNGPNGPNHGPNQNNWNSSNGPNNSWNGPNNAPNQNNWNGSNGPNQNLNGPNGPNGPHGFSQDLPKKVKKPMFGRLREKVVDIIAPPSQKSANPGWNNYQGGFNNQNNGQWNNNHQGGWNNNQNNGQWNNNNQNNAPWNNNNGHNNSNNNAPWNNSNSNNGPWNNNQPQNNNGPHSNNTPWNNNQSNNGPNNNPSSWNNQPSNNQPINGPINYNNPSILNKGPQLNQQGQNQPSQGWNNSANDSKVPSLTKQAPPIEAEPVPASVSPAP